MAEDGRDGGPGLAPFIGYCESDLTPDELRTEVGRIRAALPRLLALADIASGIRRKLSAAQVLRNVDRLLTTDGDPTVTAFIGCIKELVRKSDHPAATVERIASIITRYQARNSAEARQALTEFLTEHGITQIPADDPSGHMLREPLYFTENGSRFLVTPVDAAPADTLEYVRSVFARQKQTAGPRVWTITTRNGVSVSGYLPAWADGDPSEPDCPADRLDLHLADLTHWAPFDGQPVSLCAPGEPGTGPDRYEEDFLRGSITCCPYSSDAAERVPLVNITVVQDHVIENLDPDGVTAIAAKLRAQADRLDQVAQQLVDARADWAANAGMTA